MQKTKTILKKVWEHLNNYESDYDFIMRMKREHPNEFKNLSMW